MQINKYGKVLIGLTGNIASGKSLASSMFSNRLFERIDSDYLAQIQMARHSDSIIDLVGKEITDGDGRIDRNRLSLLAFSDRELMKRLENIIHPYVIAEIDNLIKRSRKRIILIESAIIFESNLIKNFEKIITVFAPFETRLERIMRRNNIKRDDAIRRIDFQFDEYQKILKSDYVIDNSGGKDWLRSQIKNVEKSIFLNWLPDS